MIKNNLKTLIVTSVVILLPILAGILLWNQLPEQLPVHWNASGEVDGWSSKAMGVFGFPALLLAVQWLCVFGTSADPKKAAHSEKVLKLVLWIVPILSVVLNGIIFATAMGKDLPVDMVAAMLVGVIIAIIGNYLPKCKQNYTIGIKIPWTLNSEENWNRTHRFAGRLWTVCGLVVVLAGLVDVLWIMLGTFIIIAFVPMVYSYILHRKGI